MELYQITNAKETTEYLLYFTESTDCRHWITNTLDLSEDWTYSPVDFDTYIKETTEDKYWEMLEVLPPLRMFQSQGVEGFLMSEYQTRNITSCYCSYKDTYIHLFVRDTDTYTEIVERVLAYCNQ